MTDRHSNRCCNARVIDETDVCSLCFEHCTPIDEELEEELSWLSPEWQPKSIKYNGKEIR